MTTRPNVLNPFQAALDDRMTGVAEQVREHFGRPPGRYVYRGVMSRVWRRGGWRGRLAWPFLWAAHFGDTLFAETGFDVPFEVEHVVNASPGGGAAMTFRRTFYFPGVTRRFDAHLAFDPGRAAIIDRLGRHGWLEVELHPRVESPSGALCVCSGRQWLRVGSTLRVRVPHWLAGTARVREWQDSGGRLGISVVIHNPILGDFFGYEGTFEAAGPGGAMPGKSRPRIATTKEVER